jgi:hypothetical protein
MFDTHLFTELSQLDRADKLRIMQFLIIELAKEEGSLLKNNAQYPVWSPYNSYEAAGTLLNLLNNDKSKQSHD